MLMATETHYTESGSSPPSARQERRARFNRLFPARVEKLRQSLRVLENCSKSHCLRNKQLTDRAWYLIAKEFQYVAKSFDVNVRFDFPDFDLDLEAATEE